MAQRRELDPALAQRRKKTREISPDHDGYSIEYNGNIIGEIGVDTSNSQVEFRWYSNPWPSDFSLVDSNPSGTVIQTDKIEHAKFPSSSSSCDPSVCDYVIEQSGVVIGYLQRKSTEYIWHATQASAAGGYLPAGTTDFKAHTHTTVLTSWTLIDDVL